MNLVVLTGRLTSIPSVRQLQSGSVLVSLEVSAVDTDGTRSNAPVAWFDPPRSSSVAHWTVGEQVAVLGAVRRRFYRAAGSTQSRTEVVATSVVKVSSTRSAQRLIDDAGRCLGAALAGELPSG